MGLQHVGERLWGIPSNYTDSFKATRKGEGLSLVLEAGCLQMQGSQLCNVW